MSNDVLYGLNLDIKCRKMANKILLKYELLVSQDLFFLVFFFLLKRICKIHGKGSFSTEIST